MPNVKKMMNRVTSNALVPFHVISMSIQFVAMMELLIKMSAVCIKCHAKNRLTLKKDTMDLANIVRDVPKDPTVKMDTAFAHKLVQTNLNLFVAQMEELTITSVG